MEKLLSLVFSSVPVLSVPFYPGPVLRPSDAVPCLTSLPTLSLLFLYPLSSAHTPSLKPHDSPQTPLFTTAPSYSAGPIPALCFCPHHQDHDLQAHPLPDICPDTIITWLVPAAREGRGQAQGPASAPTVSLSSPP